MSKWLKEPLLHFILLGGLVFYVYGQLAGKGAAADEIFISAGQQENLINTFSRTWQRPPTPEEFNGLLIDLVRQEIAYREGQNMGLDKNDIIIRRRMRQKLELLAEDIASLSPPTDQDLQTYLDENPEEYMIEPRFSLVQIYFSEDRRGRAAEQDARQTLTQLQNSEQEIDFDQFGDPLPLPAEMDDLRMGEIARMFGTVFTDELSELVPGRWDGPIMSGFGLHLVFVKDRVEGRLAKLEDVRDAVQRDWFATRRRDSVDGLYERLAENYTIEFESLTQELEADTP